MVLRGFELIIISKLFSSGLGNLYLSKIYRYNIIIREECDINPFRAWRQVKHKLLVDILLIYIFIHFVYILYYLHVNYNMKIILLFFIIPTISVNSYIVVNIFRLLTVRQKIILLRFCNLKILKCFKFSVSSLCFQCL